MHITWQQYFMFKGLKGNQSCHLLVRNTTDTVSAVSAIRDLDLKTPEFGVCFWVFFFTFASGYFCGSALQIIQYWATEQAMVGILSMTGETKSNKGNEGTALIERGRFCTCRPATALRERREGAEQSWDQARSQTEALDRYCTAFSDECPLPDVRRDV